MGFFMDQPDRLASSALKDSEEQVQHLVRIEIVTVRDPVKWNSCSRFDFSTNRNARFGSKFDSSCKQLICRAIVYLY